MNIGWYFKMAWRESRRSRGRLILFASSIILGIAALVAINSFDANLRENIESQSKELLGADLRVFSSKPLLPEQEAIIKSLGESIEAEQSTEVSFASMILFPKTGDTRLVAIRALEGDFPYYGKMSTNPSSAATEFRKKQATVIDKTLMIQFGVEVGDIVKIGALEFEVSGSLLGVPGQTGFGSAVAPAVFIPKRYLEQTGLVQKGSRIENLAYYKVEDSEKLAALIEEVKPQLKKNNLRFTTVQKRKEDVADAFSFANKFLNLVAFLALLLGCIGVASSIHVYIKSKVKTVAVLRCIGMTGWQSFSVFLIQILAMGIIGSILGAILGSSIQMLLPTVFSSFLPVDVVMKISWSSILLGIITGIIVSILFALWPLLSIRNISPLNTLRESDGAKNSFDFLRMGVLVLIGIFIAGFAYFQIRDFKSVLLFCGFLIFSLGILIGISALIIWAVKKFFPSRFPYVLRQGLSNLYRPNNQTLILVTCIGLGTALISTLFFTQDLLISQVEFAGTGNQPNMILFDIQKDQAEELEEMAAGFELPIIQKVPLITMRLNELNGKSIEELSEDPDNDVSRGMLNREARVTFRGEMVESESLTEGEFTGNFEGFEDVPVSIAERYQNLMDLKLGDRLVFDVHGTLISTIVTSIRKVDWTKLQTNFFIIFPLGVLEEAPFTNVLVTRVPNNEVSAKFQQSVVTKFPNVSAVDLSLILKTVEDLLNKVSFVIRFMALFSIITGLLILVGSVIISRYQRVKESVLLRTIGGTRKQILTIYFVEYFILGSLASLSGILLALLACWLLAMYSFKMVFIPGILPIFMIYIVITGLTVLIGMLNSAGILSKSPLEVLRME